MFYVPQSQATTAPHMLWYIFLLVCAYGRSRIESQIRDTIRISYSGAWTRTSGLSSLFCLPSIKLGSCLHTSLQKRIETTSEPTLTYSYFFKNRRRRCRRRRTQEKQRSVRPGPVWCEFGLRKHNLLHTHTVFFLLDSLFVIIYRLCATYYSNNNNNTFSASNNHDCNSL